MAERRPLERKLSVGLATQPAEGGRVVMIAVDASDNAKRAFDCEYIV